MGVCISTKKNKDRIGNINKNKRSKTIYESQEKEDKSNLSSKGTIEKENVFNSVNSDFKNDINDISSDIKNDKNDIINVKFVSSNQDIEYTINCSKNQYFYEIEEKLYEKYPIYRDSNNYFIFEGKVILRFKTIEQNGIKDGITLILNEIDKDFRYNTNSV